MIQVRHISAAGLSVLVTLGLLFTMNSLIQTGLTGPKEAKEYKVPEIVMPEREIRTVTDTSKPEKPEEVEAPPPDLPKMEFDNPEAGTDVISVAPTQAEKPQIGGLSTMDGDMIPLAVPEPEYPRSALSKGKEGTCVAKFTVTAQGTTRDIVLGDCPDTVFERSTLKAAERLKFKPKIVDGNPVDVPGQAYKYVYRMAQDDKKK
jgi:periplasmic protein TonB